jgi:hypothetical protein
MTLIFYELEEFVQRKSYNKILNRKQLIKYHKKLCKQYNLKTTLKFNNKTNGYYDTEIDEIGVPEKASLGLLIHEIGHAYEHKRYGLTEHKNRLFTIINEINIVAESY